MQRVKALGLNTISVSAFFATDVAPFRMQPCNLSRAAFDITPPQIERSCMDAQVCVHVR